MNSPEHFHLHGHSQSQEFNFYLTRSMYLLEAASTFGFFLMVFGGFLYWVGNLQYFSDATMTFIINLMRFFGFMAVGVNLVTLVLIVLWGIRTRHVPLGRFVFSFMCMLIGLALSLGAVLIQVLSFATGGGL